MHCFICNEIFLSLNDLLHHFKHEHKLGSNYPYRCLEGACVELFEDLASFKKHILRMHTQLTKEVSPLNNELKTLLKSWNQEYLANYLIDEKISVEILKIMKRHHIWQLLKTFKMGQIILFEHHLETWRGNIGMPLGPNDFSLCPHEIPASPNCSLKIKDVQSVAFIKSSDYGASPTLNKNSELITSSPAISKPSTYSNLLDFILNNSMKGQSIIEFYKKKNFFEEEQRKMLINIIARYFEENDLHLTLSESYKLEKEIVERFPTERVEFYRQGKRGRIYIKLCNLKRSFKSIKQTEKKSDDKNENDIQDQNIETNFETLFQDMKRDDESAEESE